MHRQLAQDEGCLPRLPARGAGGSGRAGCKERKRLVERLASGARLRGCGERKDCYESGENELLGHDPGVRRTRRECRQPPREP